jgi:hypothetical protein
MNYIGFLLHLNNIGVSSLISSTGEKHSVSDLISIYTKNKKDSSLDPDYKSRHFADLFKILSQTNKCAVCKHADIVAFSGSGGSLTFCKLRNNTPIPDTVKYCLKFDPIKTTT